VLEPKAELESDYEDDFATFTELVRQFKKQYNFEESKYYRDAEHNKLL